MAAAKEAVIFMMKPGSWATLTCFEKSRSLLFSMAVWAELQPGCEAIYVSKEGQDICEVDVEEKDNSEVSARDRIR